ncbi:MAG: hypothetical protein AB1Z66_12435 [Candidatus Limnocylindrales bacterium]
MLTITPTAADVLNRARTEKGAPDDSAVRFFATEAVDAEGARLAFKFVESPQAGDTVLTESPIEACVAADVDELIGDATIDTRTTDGDVGLVVRRTPAE